MDLILFYANGQTYRFGNVCDLKINNDEFEFKYFGESTKQTRKARFTGVVGYSIAGDGVAVR